MIFKVTGLRIPRSPMVALLNHHIPKVPSRSQKLIKFILIGAKISIARSWKHNNVSLRQIKNKVTWIMTQEKMVSKIFDSVAQFENIWTPWAAYVGVELYPGMQLNHG